MLCLLLSLLAGVTSAYAVAPHSSWKNALTPKGTPSELAKEALLRSGAGVHGERRKRNRQKDRQEEIEATLEGDVEE